MERRILLSLVCVALMSFSAAQAGLLSHWTLDETSGTTVADNIGGNTGTVMQDAAADLTAAGVFNTGIDTLGQGVGGGYIKASNIFTGNDARAISLWFNADAILANQARLIGMGIGAASQFDMTVEQFGGINSIGVRYGNGNMAWSGTAELGTAIQTDTWYHVVVQYDGTTLVADSTLEVYVNGTKLARDGGNNNNSGQVLTTSNTNFYIGKEDVYSHTFDGTIDDVRVFDGVLTQAEITALAVPEPATIAVLSLGALVLCRKRRA